MRAFHSILILITNFSVLFVLSISAPSFAQAELPTELEKFRRQIVHKVEITGARSFSPSGIKGLLYTKPNRWYNVLKKRYLSKSNVQLDVATIERYYRRRGFLFASVDDSISAASGNKVVVTFNIDEGRMTYLSGSSVRGGRDAINEKFAGSLRRFQVGQPVNAGQVLAANFALRDLYRDNGYPYALVTYLFEFNADRSLAFVRYTVAESVYTLNGQTRYDKRGVTDRNVVLRELVGAPGEEYRHSDIAESERRLYSTGLFRFVNLSRDDSSFTQISDSARNAIDQMVATVGFNLNLEERKASFANVGIGLGREEKFETVFRGSIQLGNRNLWGSARKLFLSYQPRVQVTDPQGALPRLRLSDLNKKLRLRPIRHSIELNYVEPWFLNRRIPATARLIYEPSTYNPTLQKRYHRYAGEVQFTYEFDRFTTARMTATTEYVNFIDVDSDQQEAYRAEGDNQVRRKIQLYGQRDTRDNFFVPQHGSYSFVGVEYVGGLLGGDFSYLKTQFSWSRYKILSGQNILASRIWLGWLDDIGRKKRSAVEDRFLLGGGTTVRGYAENYLGPLFTAADDPGEKLGKPKGGRYLILGNIEIRRSLFWRFGGAAFVDAGNTYFDFDDITPLSVAFTSGLGLQFFTPVGPIRFDYGVRLKRDFDLGAGNYHLSILYAF